MSYNALYLIAGNSEICDALFTNWTKLKGRYQFFMAQSSKRDCISWAKHESLYDPAARTMSLFEQCYNTETLPIYGRAIEECLPRVMRLIKDLDRSSLFGQQISGRQRWGMTCVKMFKNARQDDIDRVALAFGRPRCTGKGITELFADLESQLLVGKDVDMTCFVNSERSLCTSICCSR